MANELPSEEIVEMRVFDIVNNVREEDIIGIIVGFAESSDEGTLENFIKNYCSIFSSYVDRGANTVEGNYVRQLIARACSGGEFRDLVGLYANFLFNLNFKESYLIDFQSTTVGDKQILDMNSPIWEENTENLIREPFLKRFADSKESRYLQRLSTFLKDNRNIRTRIINFDNNILLPTKYIG